MQIGPNHKHSIMIIAEGLSFKEKKEKKLRAQAKSSHNWNTLFLGANAVADAVAAAYNTTKEQLLTENSKSKHRWKFSQSLRMVTKTALLRILLFVF